jgi:NAD(P)-dependent dehydrogenase (short-subunit alcohol dehydrogenase family)
MKKIIVVTGASSGFGALTARALAKAGHTVYASMRETKGRNAPQVEEAKKFAKDNDVDLRTIELDVASQESADAAIQKIIAENKRLDVVIHNAGHMVFGPAEAFTAEQLGELYDVNVLSTQRVNRAALPQLRRQGEGLVVWVSSSSVAGGTPPYLAPYFAAKAGMDALAVVYARELTRWGIETSIIVPGAFTGGTNHFAHAGSPADKARVAEYEAGPYKGFADEVREGFASIVPADADVAAVADAIVKVIDMPFGKRPFRVHIDPTQDGAEVVNAVSDRVRAELLRRIGLGDLLTPRDLAVELQTAASASHVKGESNRRTLMSKLEGKVAVITGGNSGIGLATAQRFVAEGAYVFITGRRQSELDAAVKQIGESVTAVQGDVSNLATSD